METVADRVETQTDTRKCYDKPQIIHELELETRAGSTPVPQIIIDPLDSDQQWNPGP